jgi:hypothetical protein
MRSSLIRRSAAVAVVLLAGVSLVACDDEPDPGPETESSSTPSEPSTSPVTTSSPTTPVEPTLPAAAEKATKAGAEAFVEYYWEVVNYAQRSGELGLLERLAVPTCGGCNSGASRLETIFERKGRIDGGQHSVHATTAAKSPSGAWSVGVRVSVTKQTVRGAGDLNATYAASQTELIFGLTHDGSTWRVTSLEPK